MWQPRSKQKRKCSRCGEKFYVLHFGGAASGGNLASDATECPNCRKRRSGLLARSARNQPPPESGR